MSYEAMLEEVFEHLKPLYESHDWEEVHGTLLKGIVRDLVDIYGHEFAAGILYNYAASLAPLMPEGEVIH